MKALVWFRRDLRLMDNPALVEALASGLPVEAIYIHEPGVDALVSAGRSASHWYLHYSLVELQKDLAGTGIPLWLMPGSAETVLPAFCAERGVTQVFCNRVVEPAQEARDDRLTQVLTRAGISVSIFPDDCLVMPEQVYKKDGSAYRVFTPFWKNLREHLEARPLRERLSPVPGGSLQPISCSPRSADALRLLPEHPWQLKLHQYWQPGEASAHRLLESFLETKSAGYGTRHDFPAIDVTSRLSPSLHFGEISVARVYSNCREAWDIEQDEDSRSGIVRFLGEIGWREFSRHVLHAFPETVDNSLNARFDQDAAWEQDSDGSLLQAWQRGETGIALVDAGMHELWETGWMHNRVRMIVASFLTKNLGIHWRQGAHWFRDTLVDADLASNTLGWQWVAGCGTDAAPYFRIFNPDTQAKKFDPEGRYISRWLGNRRRPPAVVDLKASRARALERYHKVIRKTAG